MGHSNIAEDEMGLGKTLEYVTIFSLALPTCMLCILELILISLLGRYSIGKTIQIISLIGYLRQQNTPGKKEFICLWKNVPLPLYLQVDFTLYHHVAFTPLAFPLINSYSSSLSFSRSIYSGRTARNSHKLGQ
jgi:hypothetical protein